MHGTPLAEPQLTPSRWVRRGPPGLALWDPASLTAEDIRAMWQFRRRFVDLKPTVDPDEDHADYAAFVRSASDVWAWLDRGTLVGSAVHSTGRIEFRGRTHHDVQSDYGFIDPRIRGRALAMMSQAWVYTRMILAHPRSPTYVVGFTYPHSYLVYAGTLSRCWLLGAPDVPAEERAFAEHLAEHLGGERWDPARRRYAFPTLPRERRPSPGSPARAAALARYQALNPDWHEGFGLFMVARVGPRSLAEAGLSMLSRARHTRARRT